mgnify:CR=1 FL=1
MKNIFEFAAYCLHTHQFDEKLARTRQAWVLDEKGQLDYQSTQEPQPISKTRFPKRPELLDPQDMPNRKLSTVSGLRAFFHAIAHIEWMAIYLAWDILYRFRQMPLEFYHDWLRVAHEEVEHFSLVRGHMNRMGIDYGDLPAHRGLWDVAEKTANDLMARLALVPRYMEARGLDVTPGMIEKFANAGDWESVDLLTRILHDEVGHVELGSRCFRYVCDQNGLESEEKYKELITQYQKTKRKVALNREFRKKAGFSDAELDWLEN